MYLKVFLLGALCLGGARSAFKDGRILTFDEKIGEFDEFQKRPSEYQYVEPVGQGGAEVATIPGVGGGSGGGGGSVSTPGRLLALLRDRYVRTPLAVVVDTEPTALRDAKRLWRETLEGVEDDQVNLVLLPYNATGMGPVYKTKGLPWFRQVLHSVPAVPTPPHTTGGVAFYSVLKATEQTPYDSAILLFTGRQAVDEYLAQLTAATLVQKRTKLHVVWFGGPPSAAGRLGADLLYREMTASTGGVFVVADVFIDVVDESVDMVPLTTGTPDREAEATNSEEVYIPTVEAPVRDDDTPSAHEVTVTVRHHVTGIVTTPVYVDSTIHGLRVTLAGPVSAAVLRQPSGMPIDLLSGEALRRWPSGGARVLHRTDALLDLQLNTSAVAPGVWELVTNGGGGGGGGGGQAGSYNVSVKAFSKLSFTASLSGVDKKDRVDGADTNGSKQLRLTMTGVGSIALVTLLDGQGKELRQLTYQRRDGNEADPNDQFTTDLDMPRDIETPSTMFVKLSGQDPTGAEFTRVSQVSLERQTYVGPTNVNEAVTIDVAANSSLYIQPNQQGQIVYQVTNNRNVGILYKFVANDNGRFIRSINPKQAYIGPQLTFDVFIGIAVPSSVVQGTTDIVTLFVTGQYEQAVKKSALVTVGEKVWDPERPYIWHSIKVNCRAYTEPDVCYTRVWNVEVHIEDRHSGLLYVKSAPRGIRFNSDWIAGTKTSVVGYYSASCCENTVDILAMDVNGQYIKYPIDGDDTWIGLSSVEIIAIVLGSLLLILIIVAIILAACLCRGKSKRSHDLPVHPRTTRR